jgi:nucleoside-diphosphate-sugar epimerase
VLAHKGEPIIKVWGTGDQLRDFIHIEDCVDGVLATMDRINDGGALNLSTGIYTSFKQFAAMAAKVCGFDTKVEGMSDKPAGVFARAGDTRKQAEYGFKYKISFEEGIKRAIDSYQKNG